MRRLYSCVCGTIFSSYMVKYFFFFSDFSVLVMNFLTDQNPNSNYRDLVLL